MRTRDSKDVRSPEFLQRFPPGTTQAVRYGHLTQHGPAEDGAARKGYVRWRYASRARMASICSDVAWTAGSLILVEMGSPLMFTAALMAETNRSQVS